MGSSTGTRNFGMRRFTNLVREGTKRAPESDVLRLGHFVEVDPGDTDRVRLATEVATGGADSVRTKLCGILWYEHDAQTYNTPAFGRDASGLAQDLWYAPVNRLVQVLHGPGVKVWFRNTGDSETEPGLNFANERPEVIMVDGLGATPTLAVDDLLGWDDTGPYYTATTDVDKAIFRVTKIYPDGKTVDAEMLV